MKGLTSSEKLGHGMQSRFKVWTSRHIAAMSVQSLNLDSETVQPADATWPSRDALSIQHSDRDFF